MTPQQEQILALERRFYLTRACKEADIASQTGLSAIRYYQKLNELLDQQDAMEAEPVLVHRLRRIRDGRATVRRGL